MINIISFDDIAVLFADFVLHIVRLNDYTYIAIMICIIAAIATLITLRIVYYFNKSNSNIRFKTLMIGQLLCYDICTLVFALLLKWWIAIIIIIICTFIIRKSEKSSIELEVNNQIDKNILSKDKDNEIYIKDMCNGIKGIIINIVLSFIIAQLIIFVLES